MESIISYLTENSIVGMIVLVLGIVFVASIIRSLFKMAMAVAMIGLVMVVFLDFQPEEVVEKGTDIANVGTTFYENNIKPLLTDKLLEEEILIEQKDGETEINLNALKEQYDNLDELINNLSEEDLQELEQLIPEE